MKTAPNISDVKTMLERVVNSDIDETLQNKDVLEDTIFQNFDRLQVLLAMQSRLDSSEPAIDLPNRAHFSQLLDEQANELRRLVDSYIG